MSISLIKQKGIQSYKPMAYPEAYERFKTHEQAHWLPEEVPLGDDIKDWNKLADAEKEFIKSIFLLFTQNDVQVGAGYDVLLRIFKPTEVQMMLRSHANRENVHIDAYSLLLDTLGFDEDVYTEFMDIPVMKTKVDYIEASKVKKYEVYEEMFDDFLLNEASPDMHPDRINKEKWIEDTYKRDVAKMLAVYASFTEGVSLFAQFALLLNYQRFNKLKGMCQIVTWSIRDEEMHVQNNSWLFRKFIAENPEIWDDKLKHEIYEAARQVCDREMAYVDYVFDQGITEGITRDDLKNYIRYITDRRLLLVGMKPNYGIEKNPLAWMDEILNTVEFTNFFENRVTEYSKSATAGNWSEIREELGGTEKP